MKYLILVFSLICTIGYGQGISPSQFEGSPYSGGYLKAVVKIWDDAILDSVYVYQHSPSEFSRIDSMTFANDTLSIYTTDSIFQVEILSGGGGGGTITGNGTTNKVAFWASSDSLTHDTMFSFLPANDRLGIGITTPTGLGVGLHLHGGTFTDLHLTNPTTGTASSDGTSLFISSTDTYLTNRENGDIVLATQNIERIRIDEDGILADDLKSGGTAPTTSGTLVKLVSDANGRISFQANNSGTVTSVGLTTGTSGTDINVSGSPVTGSGTFTLNIPTSSGTNRGALSSADWTTFNNKIGGSGVTNRIPYFSSSSDLTSASWFALNPTNYRLDIKSANNSINIGQFAGTSVQGDYNYNFGQYAGSELVSTNVNNVNIGRQPAFSMKGNATGNVNIGDVYYYGRGNANVNIGNGVNNGNTSTGNNNVYVGASVANTAGSHYENVGLGYNVLISATTGFRNVANGSYSLNALTTGSENLGLGFYGGGGITTHSGCVGVGGYSLGITNGGNNSTAIGYYAGANNTGGELVAIGSTAGRYQGQRSVAIGAGAGGSSSATGNTNIFLGYTAGFSETASNVLYIANNSGTSNGIYGNFANARFGVNLAPSSMARTFDINGELRVRDMVTDNPTFLGGVDNDGDFGRVTLGTGLSFTGTTLNAAVGDSDWGVIGSDMCNWGATGSFGSGLNVGIGTCSPSRDLDVQGDARLRGAIYNSSNSAGTSGQVLTSQGSSAWTWTNVGTITSIGTNNGITGGTITTSGTIGLTGQALALHNLATNGIIARTGTGTVAARTITGTSGVAVTNGDGVAANPNVALTGLPLSINNLASNGIIVKTGATTASSRTITGGSGITVTNGDGVSGNPTIAVKKEWGHMFNSGTTNLTTAYVKMSLSATGSDEGDGADIQTDAVNNEIDILTTGDYHIELRANCKSNTSGHTVTFDVLSQTGTSMSCETKHYYGSTTEYSHNNMIWRRNITSGTSFGLYAKTSSGTPNINDCTCRILVERLK